MLYSKDPNQLTIIDKAEMTWTGIIFTQSCRRLIYLFWKFKADWNRCVSREFEEAFGRLLLGGTTPTWVVHVVCIIGAVNQWLERIDFGCCQCRSSGVINRRHRNVDGEVVATLPCALVYRRGALCQKKPPKIRAAHIFKVE